MEICFNLRPDKKTVRWLDSPFSSFSAKVWLNIITGKYHRRGEKRALNDVRLRHLLIPEREASPAARRIAWDMRVLSERGVRLLQVYSEGDQALDYMKAVYGDKMRQHLVNGTLTMGIVRGANHTLTLLWSQERLLKLVCEWVQATYARGVKPIQSLDLP